MGNRSSRFGTDLTPEELDEYSETTFFTKGELVELRHKFLALTQYQDTERVSFDALLAADFLAQNPFRHRILKTFQSTEESSLSFDDFVTMCSAFAARTPKQVKLQAAFKIYDYDGDGFISRADVRAVVTEMNKAYGDESSIAVLNAAQIEEVAMKVMHEIDYDRSGRITFYEFSKIVGRVRDFRMKFRLSGI